MSEMLKHASVTEMNPADITQIRSFNRTVAEGIGALNDHFLGRGRPMGESRLLWEIGPQGVDLRVLRERLGLDSGYLSRTLASLERQGLVQVDAHPDDRRVRRASLTEAGSDERAELERLSDAVAGGMLAPLSEAQRRRLIGAMAEVERLLQPSLMRFAIEDPAGEEAQWCIGQYFAELNTRFAAGFDPSLSLSADARELTAPHGALIVARLHGAAMGCVALKFHGKAAAELKRMWVSGSARGLGVGRRLLAEAERHARTSGAKAVRLETNDALKEAIALYRQAGYIEVAPFSDEPYADHWFEKALR